MRNAPWVNTALSAGLPYTKFPAYCAFPILLTLVHPRMWTLSIALVVFVAQGYLFHKGYTLAWFLRRCRSRLYGARVSARPIWVIRRFSRIQGPY
ncbi:IcmT/TraK family protein [Pusillimonas maritima]|uniref:IcmT/TraK family protein n=1 Tax=Neopusillimonas maritima TaxID=2026239 RepID=UPI001C583114